MSTTSYIHAPAGNAFLLHEDAGPSFRDDPAVAGNSAGTRFFGAWSREGVLEGRLFNADGTPAADLVTLSRIAGPDAHDEVSVTALADGRFIVSYTDSQGDIWGNIRARLVNADGSPAAILHIDTELNPAFGAMGSAVAALADGGFAVTWTRYDVGDGDVFGDSDIHMQIYNADGSLRHATGPLAADPARSAEGSSTAGLAGGGIVVVCREETIDHDDLRFRRFTADGTALDGASGVLIDAGAAIGSAQVAALPDGGFAIAYQDLKWGNSFDIAARIYNADGSARTAPLYVNSAMNGGDPSASTGCRR